jgi:pyruvate/2-oxoglutarate dehydrogenase complex dihydrolipoamide dehydrogenase (E3) component
MNDVSPRRGIHGPEHERFWEVVDEALRARVTRADFLPPQVVEEREVRVYCLNRGGVPGKRYLYESGWVEAFRHDLHDGYFLAA